MRLTFQSIIPLTLVVGLLMGAPFTATAQEVGNVNVVVNYAYGTPPGDEKAAIYKRDKIYANEVVETVTDGGLHIIFADQTDLRLGSKSRLVIDNYVYDPGNPNQAGVFSLTSGVLRLISGQMNKQGVLVRTPDAEIGIRGTDIQVTTGEQGTELAVFKGSATLTNSRDRSSVTVNAGQKAATGPEKSAAVTGAAPSSPSDKSLGDGGGSGGSGGREKASCFASGTEVLMGDGSARAIEDIQVGDMVVGQAGTLNRVRGIETPELGYRSLYAINGERPFVTAEHPFLTESGWRAIDPSATAAENPAMSTRMAGALRVGDHLAVSQDGVAPASLGRSLGQSLPVDRLTAIPGYPATKVYNLLLDGDHTYLVRETALSDHWYRVHNKY